MQTIFKINCEGKWGFIRRSAAAFDDGQLDEGVRYTTDLRLDIARSRASGDGGVCWGDATEC
jgi:hypothetical protein